MNGGLDDLDEMAQKRSRGRRGDITPPSRHPRPAAESQPEPTSPDTGVPAHEDTGTPAAPPAETPAPTAAARAGTPARGQARTRPPSIEAYLTTEQMDWLWQVRAAAVARRRENVQSSVVRLALDELAARMSPEQIAERIADQEPPPSGGTARGRRR